MIIFNPKSPAVRSLGPILGTLDPIDAHKVYTQVLEEKALQFQDRWNFDIKDAIPNSTTIPFSVESKTTKSLDGKFIWSSCGFSCPEQTKMKMKVRETETLEQQNPSTSTSSSKIKASDSPSRQTITKPKESKSIDNINIKKSVPSSSSSSKHKCFKDNTKDPSGSDKDNNKECCSTKTQKDLHLHITSSSNNRPVTLKQRHITDYMKVRKNGGGRSKKHLR